MNLLIFKTGTRSVSFGMVDALLDDQNWQQETLRLKFTGIARWSGVGGGASLCRAVVSCDSPEIENARRVLSQDWGTKELRQGKELTQLVISDDVPLLTIVFADYKIEHLSESSGTIIAKFSEFDDPES